MSYRASVTLHVRDQLYCCVTAQVTDTALQSKLQQATADLYRMLTPCLTDPSQAQLVEVSLPAAAAIWVGDGYCQGTLAALQPEEGAEGLRPLLFAVPHEFWQYSELLKLAGVRDRYDSQQLCVVMHSVAIIYLHQFSVALYMPSDWVG